MALRAGRASHFDNPLLPDHITSEWNRAVLGNRHRGLFVESSIEKGGTRRVLVSNRRIEDKFTRANPIRLSLQPGSIEDDFRLLLLEPLHIARRFFAWSIDGIALINLPDGHSVVVVGTDMHGRVTRVGQRHFEFSDGLIVPGLWNLRQYSVFRLLRVNNDHDGADAEQHQQNQHHKSGASESHFNPPDWHLA